MAEDNLSYGSGYFMFDFKDGSTLKLLPNGQFEHEGGNTCDSAISVAGQAQPPVLTVYKPQFGDTEEAHILSVILGAVVTTKVVMRGLLELRRERNRSLEAREINRTFSADDHKRIE